MDKKDLVSNVEIEHVISHFVPVLLPIPPLAYFFLDRDLLGVQFSHDLR